MVTSVQEMPCPSPPTFRSKSSMYGGIDYMGPFQMLGNCEYILVVVDYVLKWAEAIPCHITAARSSKKMFQDIIFPGLGVPKVVISDGVSYFTDGNLKKYLKTQGVEHRVATPYHSQTSGQVETSNKQIKHILQKTVNEMERGWIEKFPEALWAYRTSCNTPIGMTPYQLIYGKTCHLPVELE
jgi:hypothetical protein